MEAKHIIKYTVLCAFFGGLLSCSSADDEVKIPPGILNKEQYTKVLADLSMAESAANLNIKNVRVEKLDSTYAFDPLQENRISRGSYDSTALFYANHPDLYKEVYDEVLKRLSEMGSKRKGTPKDSLKK